MLHHLEWIQRDGFDIIYNVSGYVTLVKLMQNIGNFSHEVTIYGVFIFDTNYKKRFHLSNMILIKYI